MQEPPSPARSNKCQHRDEERKKKLRESVLIGNLDRMRELVLVQRVSVNDGDQDGETPLILAVIYGHVEAARFLLQNDANADATDNEGNTALGYAILRGNLALAQLLLQNGAKIEAYILYKFSPIAWAIFLSNDAMVELLLQFGAKTDEVLFFGRFHVALFLACGHPSLRIVQLLLDHEDGIGVNTVLRGSDNIPTTPLCEVCKSHRENRVEIAQFLIERGARVIVPGDNGNNDPCPLTSAVVHATLELVRLFLKNSQLSFSTSSDSTQTSSTQGSSGAIYHPLSKPLLSALENNKLEAAQLLIDHGAVKSGYPFLFRCAQLGNREGARMLLRAGANVNQPGDDDDQQQHLQRGEMPLWAAAKNGHSELVQDLLKAGADVNIRDNGGETPLGVAYRMGHTEIVYLLLRMSPHVWMQLKEIW